MQQNWENSYENFSPTGEKKNEYTGLIVLDYMINGKNGFTQPIAVCDMWLKTVIDWLFSKGYITLNSKCDAYVPSENGRKTLNHFMRKYGEYLQFYDIFCAVDLTTGEFAFAKYWDFATDEEWKQYLAEERFADLRIAVAQLKGMDPFEIVFMSFLNEKRFDRTEKGWKRNVISGEIWKEISKICQSAWNIEDLSYGRGNDKVSGQNVIEDVIKQGADLVKTLTIQEEKNKAEAQQLAEQEGSDEEEVVTTITEEFCEPMDPYVYGAAYYDPFFDPYYVSPFWYDPWYW